jgi:hypothetical protein
VRHVRSRDGFDQCKIVQVVHRVEQARARASPPTPSGSRTLCLGPATKPSSDTEILSRSLDM